MTAAVGVCRLQARLCRATRAAFFLRLVQSSQRLAGAMFSECLTTDEKSRLTVQIYDASQLYPEEDARLSDWEEAWIARRLPPPPAHVLVGGCGTGREAMALLARGYRITALEPAPRLAAISRRRLAGRATVMQLSYEQLSASVLGHAVAGEGRAAALLDEHFDAVLLGLGSFSHVLLEHQRHRLLHALNVLCARGPVMLSFSSKRPLGAGRVGLASRLGSRAGRVIARARGIRRQDDALAYGSDYGFVYSFTPAALETLAGAAGRSVAWEHSDGTRRDYATLLRV